MSRGRKINEEGLVRPLEGSAEAKARLVMFLQTLSGRRTIGNAAQELGLSERRVYAMRNRLLQAALDGLEPRPVGRPVIHEAESDRRVAVLEAETRTLRMDLRAAQIREEIALAMPHLIRKATHGKRTNRKRPVKFGPNGVSGVSRRSAKENAAAQTGNADSPGNERCENWNDRYGPAPSPSHVGQGSSV